MAVRLFNMDLHISVIADIKDVLKRLYGEKVSVMDACLSGHAWVMGRKQSSIDIINQHTWYGLNSTLIREFQDRYDTFLSSFDGFICAHPNSFILLFEKYNKPIFLVNSCRYDIPFSMSGNKAMLPELNASFQSCQEKGILFMISNNRADNAYFLAENPGIRAPILPSLCLYTEMHWEPTAISRRKFLVYTGPAIAHPLLDHKGQLGRFQWSTLMEYRGIVHIPYEVSTMSIFEHISSGIPLFFPTKEFLKDLWISNRTNFQSNYWRKFGRVAPPIRLSHTESLDFWIDRGDMYHLEGVYYFSSFDDLFRQLETFTDPLFEVRKRFIEGRQVETLQGWRTLVDSSFPSLCS